MKNIFFSYKLLNVRRVYQGISFWGR